MKQKKAQAGVNWTLVITIAAVIGFVVTLIILGYALSGAGKGFAIFGN